MKKGGLMIFIALLALNIKAQVPYFGATVGRDKVFGYTSVKFRPGQNTMEDYTIIQFGVTDWLSLGTDLYTDKNTANHGLYARIGKVWNQWINTGTQVCWQSDLKDNYKYSNINVGFFLNGDILKNGLLFWTSNTWLTFNNGGNHMYKQWWYLGSNIKFNQSNSLVPMVGIIHSWEFDEDIDLAIGAYYVYKKYSFYIWGNDFFSSHPRGTVALDFSF